MVEVLMPGAVAATSDEVADRLSGKIVIDAMNYWAIGGGMLAEFEASPGRSSETVQAFLAGSRVVKTLNHMGYLELEEQGLPAGTPGRRAFAFAGDDPEAKMIVAGLISDLGFDSFDAGLLSEGWRFAPGSPIFGGSFNLEELRSAP
jgi:predicted dinucleotide-binding enzyme